MREIRVDRKTEDDGVTLSFRFKSIKQLLDSDDPAPLPGTELTQIAEEFIAGYLDEYRLKLPVSLILSLNAADITPDESLLLPEAVRRHFSFRVQDLMHERRLSRREGLYSLGIAICNALIAILFLSIVTVYELSLESFSVLLPGAFITIMNWVTIWDTYEHFFYDFHDLLRRKKMYEKISRIPIAVERY
ncbi:hypothetical protein L1S32_00020 [Methanogenium sp. S4BF]|uniref:hypothetical protein n=1 Tax=Methanogenium sp. S4BF TaxID=1789226 RepID=UPI002416659A|nr:hypothetical protein [Methanogenium sp. S4BF]WFN34543.1 hypothetical protein L1S32_00020 [Methanogenium sp. S4BF]